MLFRALKGCRVVLVHNAHCTQYTVHVFNQCCKASDFFQFIIAYRKIGRFYLSLELHLRDQFFVLLLCLDYQMCLSTVLIMLFISHTECNVICFKALIFISIWFSSWPFVISSRLNSTP
jgi:hypothetical protein